MSEPKNKPDYEVGYRKPPKANQFKPGQSGNKKGRPKGRKNLRTIVDDTLYQRVKVTENGKTRTLTAFEVICLTAMRKAMEGDHRARNAVFVLTDKYLSTQPDYSNPTDAEISPDDQTIIDEYINSVIANQKNPSSGNAVTIHPVRQRKRKPSHGDGGKDD